MKTHATITARCKAGLLGPVLSSALVAPVLLLAANARAQSTATSPAMSGVTVAPDTEDPPLPAPIAAPPSPAPIPAAIPANPPPDAGVPAAALPAGSGALDSATVQRITDRLVALHFLPSAADAQNPDALMQAIKDFQAGAGISPSGTLDRDTVGRLTTP